MAHSQGSLKDTEQDCTGYTDFDASRFLPANSVEGGEKMIRNRDSEFILNIN